MTAKDKPVREEPGELTLRLATVLSAGLDLCVRARKMDAVDRTTAMVDEFPGIDLERAAPRLNEITPWAPYETRSATIPVWVQEHYERDLAEWESAARKLLLESGLAIRLLDLTNRGEP